MQCSGAYLRRAAHFFCSARSSAALALVIASAPAVRAQVSAAPDVTVDLSGVTVTDEQVAIDDLVGGIALETFAGSLPAGAEVDAYHDDGSSGVLFSVDTAVLLPGGLVARPEDVVRLDGGAFKLVLDGSAEGVPAGVGTDAVTRSGGDLVLSFDATVVLDGVTVEDEDLARFDGAVFTLALDASAVGVDRSLDTDAVAEISPGVFGLSFDGHGALGGVNFADEDVVSVNTSGPTFALLFDASAEHAGWSPADLGALPEPGAPSGVAAGALLLAVLARRRRAAAD